MESKHVRPELSRNENRRYVRDLFGSRPSIFGTLSSFIVKTADLTEEIFASRYPAGMEAGYPEFAPRKETIWHIALLSLAQFYGGLTFEEVMNRSHIEIAGASFLLNPDMRLPIDQRVVRYTAGLSRATNLTKIAAFTRPVSAALSLGEDIEHLHADPVQLYELSWILKELRIFTGWSRKADELWTQSADVVNSWYAQGIMPRELPRPSLHFSLNASIRADDLRQFFEE